MYTKPILDFLRELSVPSLLCSPNEPVNPLDIERYLNKVETLRVAFVAEILDCENSATRTLYEEELKRAISKIEKRGFCNLKEENISAAILAGIKEMELVNQVVRLDKGLLISANKALKAISPSEQVDTIQEYNPKEPKTEGITADVEKTDWNKPVYTSDEVKELLGLSDSTFNRWLNKGWIAYSQVAGSDKKFIQREDLLAFLNNPQIHYPSTK